MPLFFESVWALMDGNLSFFVTAIAQNLLWIFIFVAAFFFLEKKHSLFNFFWWLVGILIFFDMVALTGVPGLTFALPFHATVITLVLYSVVPEDYFFLSLFIAMSFIPIIFLL